MHERKLELENRAALEMFYSGLMVPLDFNSGKYQDQWPHAPRRPCNSRGVLRGMASTRR